MSGGARWAATIGATALTLLVVAAPAVAALRWSDCGDVEAECARVRVPLDRSGAVKGSVSLRMARFEEPSRRPTLLYLSGGPGGAGVREFGDVMFELGGLGRDYQLVSYDQRGTGGSGLLRCRALERDPRLRSPAAGEACARRLGARRAFYGTRESVEDVEALRQALGVEKLTLFGISYGTKLALAYARAHPDRVERLALDSVLDPDDADVFGLEPYRAMPATLSGALPGRLPGRERGPGRGSRPPGRAVAEHAAAGRRLRPARAAAAGDADRARARGPDVRLRLQPRAARRHPCGGAGRARQRRSGAAAAARRQRREPRLAARAAQLLVGALRDGVRGDAAAVAARGAVRRARLAGARRSRPAGARRVLPVRLRGGARGRDRPLPALARGGARAGGGRRVPGRAVADPAGGRGPAHAAGELGAGRGGAARRAAAGRAGRRARGAWAGTRRAAACAGWSRSCAAGPRRSRARAWRRSCPRSACRRRRCGG